MTTAQFVQSLRTRVKLGEVTTLIARATSASLVIQVASLALAFGLQLALARLLGSSQYGLYVLVGSWLAILIPIATLGTGESMIRLVAQFREQREFEQLKGAMLFSNWLCVCSASILVIAAIGVAVVIDRLDKLPDGFLEVFVVGAVMVPFSALAAPRKGSLRGLLKAWQSQIPDGLLRPLTILLFLGLALGFNSVVDARTAMLFNVVGAILAFVLGTVLLRRAMPEECRDAPRQAHPRAWLRLSIPFAISAWLYVLLYQVDTVVIGMYSTTADVGIYTAAYKLASLITFGASSVFAISAPMIAQAYHKGDRSRLKEVAVQSIRLNWLLTLVPVVGVMILASFLLGLFGEDFVRGRSVLWIFAVGYLLNATIGGGILGFVLTMTGHQVVATALVGGSALLNLILNLMLVPTYGIEGAAVATVVSLVALSVGKLVCVGHYLKLYPALFPTRSV